MIDQNGFDTSNSTKGGAVYSAKCALQKGRNLDELRQDINERYPQFSTDEILSKAQKARDKKNGNETKKSEQLKLVNSPRGKAMAKKDGLWADVLDTPDFKILIRKTILAAYQSEQPKIDLSELEELRAFKKRFEKLAFLTDEKIAAIATLYA